MNKRSKESNEQHSDENSGTGTLLSRFSVQDLKSIKVAIRRHDVLEPITPLTVHRSLEDPKDLILYRRRGEGQRPIFDRKGIVVNVEAHLEERIVLKSPEDKSSRRSRSKSCSDEEHSAESYRSRSPRNRRCYSRSPSATSRKDPENQSAYSKDYSRHGAKDSPSKGKQKPDGKRQEYRGKRTLDESSLKKENNRSASVDYKRSDSDRYDLKRRMLSAERCFRENSPKPGTSKGSRERERSSKGRDNESYRRDKYKTSPRRGEYRDCSPKRYDRNRSRSRSPRNLAYRHGGIEKEKYIRTRTSSTGHTKRYSTSPHSKKQSRSPNSRKRTPSPHSKRHSRSPHFKRTPPRDERGFRGSSPTRTKTRRRSGSPYERDRDYPSTSGQHGSNGRLTYSKRRSRSPYSRKHSRSPHRTESTTKLKRRSRSPFRRDSDTHHRVRSRTPSSKHRKPSESEETIYHESHATGKHEYTGIPTEFDYFGAGGFWIPGPIPRPGFIPRGVIPPMAIPRGMFRPGPSYVIPRPYLSGPHPFRTRFPVPYNRPYKPRISAPSATVTSASANTATALVATTPTTAVSVLTSSSSDPIVEEPICDSSDPKSTE